MPINRGLCFTGIMASLLVGIGLHLIMVCGGIRATAQPSDPGNRPIITRLTPAGTLTWSNLAPYSACSVEWAGAPNGPWTNTAPQLRDILTGDNTTLSATVPVTNQMRFYRVGMTPPFAVDWCRLQDPQSSYVTVSNAFNIYGRVQIAGVTDRTDGVDPQALVKAEVGYKSPIVGTWFGGGTWTNAVPNPGWSAAAAGEPNKDEYVGTINLPAPGDYYVAVRFSGDGGNSWLWGDLRLGGGGNDGSNDGFDAMTTARVTALNPELKVLAAFSDTPTQVSVYFNQGVSPALVRSDGSQFTFTNGLLAYSAVVNGSSVVLTTTLQTHSQNYTVTVGGTVRDYLDHGVSAAANTATFTGQ